MNEDFLGHPGYERDLWILLISLLYANENELLRVRKAIGVP